MISICLFQFFLAGSFFLIFCREHNDQECLEVLLPFFCIFVVVSYMYDFDYSCNVYIPIY